MIGFPDGPNNYLYANNDPVNNVDKLGKTIQESEVGGSYEDFLSKRKRFIYTERGGWLDYSHFGGSDFLQEYQKAFSSALRALQSGEQTQVRVVYGGAVQKTSITYNIGFEKVGGSYSGPTNGTAKNIALGIMASLFRTGEGKQVAGFNDFFPTLYDVFPFEKLSRGASEYSLEDLPTNWIALHYQIALYEAGSMSDHEKVSLLKKWLGNPLPERKAKRLVRETLRNGSMFDKNKSIQPILFTDNAVKADIFGSIIGESRAAFNTFVTPASFHVYPHIKGRHGTRSPLDPKGVLRP